jgi:beta-mannosidase
MLGMPREQWASSLATERLPAWVREARPDVPYVQSSTTGGALPFDANAGVTHYFGVGGYMRPLDDARRSEVRFAVECLAFAHVPEDETIDLVLGDGQSLPHNPAWKARAPRDMGTGWDHEDVRDHYVRTMFEVDPMHLRYSDPARYTALSRVVTGEVTAATFAEWRRARSTCGGALVFTYNDLWPGPGYGLVDSTGTPKAAYWYVKRACAPVAVLTTEEGVNGLAIHAINESDAPLEGHLEIALYREEARVADGKRALTLAPRTNIALSAQSLLDRFVDVTYSYRFGPAGHDVVVVRLVDGAGAVVSRAFHFPLGLVRHRAADVGLEARAVRDGDRWVATVKTRAFAQAVAVSSPGWRPDDSYFHLEPGGERTLAFHAIGAAASAPPLRASLQPLNAHAATRVAV